jgi:CheY-like chemotaxis protein/HPt (histidine-containing phosphotransfer) domain-containing protein
LAQRVSSDPQLAATRLLAMTAIDAVPMSSDLSQRGIVGLLSKPVRRARLLEFLASAAGVPVQQEPWNRTAASSAPAELPAKPLQILLAEDNLVNQRVALGHLKRMGHSAQVVSNGLEVLQAIQDTPYDVVLMDCQMPELDGYETTRRIRQQESLHPDRADSIQIIAMTAHAMEGDREKCLAAGMDDYIGKPFKTEELKAALARCQPRRSLPAPSNQPPVLNLPGAGARAVVQTPDRLLSAESRPPVDLQQLMDSAGGSQEDARALSEFFFLQAGETLENLARVVARFNVEEMERLAHKLAGSSSSCGLVSLAGVLRELEEAAHSGRLQQPLACQLHHEAVISCSQAEQFLREQFSSAPGVDRSVGALPAGTGSAQPTPDVPSPVASP